MNLKVMYIGKIFPNYRKPVFDLLNKKVELIVLYGGDHSGLKSIETNYSEKIPSYRYGRKATNVLLFPMWKIIKYKPQVVICEFAIGILNTPFILFFCKLMNIKFIFWSHLYNRKTGFHPEKKLIDKYRLFLLKAADAGIAYSKSDSLIIQNFIKQKKIFVAQNTIDISVLMKIRDRLEAEGRESVKRKLNIKHEFNLIFLSRMLASKKPDLLIQVYEILKEKYSIKAGIHFIGDGEMLPFIKNEVSRKSYEEDFYFYGSVHDDEINGELLFISDLMINPGDLGLSINYAFCFNCPVISFKDINGIPAHGPEIDYLINEKTGFLVDEHTPEALAYVVNYVLQHKEVQENLLINIKELVLNEFPLEKMISGILDAIGQPEKI